MHRDIMEQEDELRYVFLLLHPSEFNKEAIKTIMYDGKIIASDGEMVFYAPYSALFTAYHDKFQNREMWGVGFPLSLLKHCEKWKIAERYGYSVDGDLQSWKVESNIIDFSKPDYKDKVFFVAPSQKKCKEVWFAGTSEKGYKQWWCKGIHKDCLIKRTDDEINKYLDEGNYKPYYFQNHKTISKNELFPNNNLMQEGEGLRHEYSLLKMTPKDLHSGIVKKEEMKSGELF